MKAILSIAGLSFVLHTPAFAQWGPTGPGQAFIDCNGNGIPDSEEEFLDCNGNGIPDECDIATGLSTDCNNNAIPDECEPLPDCNNNGVADICDLANGASFDCDGSGVPDECEIDCNHNGIHDSCDIASGTSADGNMDGIPDECVDDCNHNGVGDTCDIAAGTSRDCNANGIPDECETLDDCNGNGIPDSCDIATAPSLDLDGNGELDACQGYSTAPLFVDDNAPLDPGPGDPSLSDPLENGSSAHPFDAIQEAIDSLPLSHRSTVILVRRGVYSGTGNKNIRFGGRRLRLQSIAGAANTIIDLQHSLTDRGFRFEDQETRQSVLDGFTITNGGALGSSVWLTGAGIVCLYNSSPTISNCVISNNVAGGGPSVGGGMSINNSSPRILNCIVRGNRAWAGAGMYLQNSNAEIRNCLIAGNEAPPPVSGYTGSTGGGMRFTHGNAEIWNSIIEDNAAEVGGGVFCSDTTGMNDRVRIYNTLIRNNRANGSTTSYPWSGHGGGIFGIPELIRNCTVTGNFAARRGGGIACLGPSEIRNSIFWNNSAALSGPEIYLPNSNPDTGLLPVLRIAFSDVQGGLASCSLGSGAVLKWDYLTNIEANPLFASEGYRLTPNSPCRNAGDPDLVPAHRPIERDLEGDRRILEGRVDMGADELRAPCQ